MDCVSFQQYNSNIKALLNSGYKPQCRIPICIPMICMKCICDTGMYRKPANYNDDAQMMTTLFCGLE